jgi:CRP-like cAMP-binding protein/RsiW-degrading membrane proteinase PrsW (M82 family)
MEQILAYLISIIIPMMALYVIYLFDLFGTGKNTTIAMNWLWGLLGAFGLSYLANTTIMQVYDVEFETISTRVAPVLEELFKLIILIYFIQQPRFRYFVDGAIYGYAVGIGFAITENIFYVSITEQSVFALAASRALSATLMHATAGAVMGLALGLGRRLGGWRRYSVMSSGILFAMFIHFIYNNLLFIIKDDLEIPVLLLPVALGIGLGGGVMIAIFIGWGLRSEKRRFEETLGADSGVSSAERRAIQGLGSEFIEELLADMALMFGDEKADLIRRLLVIQANMGILKNNLKSPVGDRLRKAWEAEIETFRQEMDDIRNKLGTYVMTHLRSTLPNDDSVLWTEFSAEVANYDPTHVHSFDLFVTASKIGETIPPEQIEQISNRLHEMEIFKHVALTDLDNLSRAIVLRQYSHGQVLFNKGAEGDAMYMIDRGYIDIIVEADGREKLLRTYEAGDVVGELALLDGQPRSATARANGPLSVMILQRKDFMRFIQSRPQVILAVLRFLADRVRYTTDAVTSEPEHKVVVPKDVLKDALPMFSPTTTDTVRSSETPLGVFGRLSKALDDLENQVDTGEKKEKRS